MRWAARATVGVILLAGLAAAGATRADELEYAVKAEVIERFTRFVDWPNQNGWSNDFTLCVVGETPMEPRLQRLAHERRIKERNVELRHVKVGPELTSCQVLFIAPTERQHLRQIVQLTSGRPILTIGDSEGYAREGVLINLYVDDDGHVRFEICSPELKKSGLNISAQLLRLARLVEEQP